MLEVDTDLQELNSYDGNSDYSDPEDYVDDISDTGKLFLKLVNNNDEKR